MRKLCVFLSVFIFTSLYAAKISWESAREVAPGVKKVEISRKKPRIQKIFILRVDMKTPGMKITINDKDADFGKPMPDCPEMNIVTKRQRTADFLMECRKNQMNMIVAANAAPWRPWKKPFNHKYAYPSGVMIKDGEVICDSGNHGAVFVVTRDGRMFIENESIEIDTGDIAVAVSGFHVMLKNGKKIEIKDNAFHPRMAYGISRNGRYLYLLAVDGRQKGYSMGMTVNELADILLEAGASEGINMDGGGSTTLVYFDQRKKKPVVLNRHDPKGSYYRTVASSIGIYIDKKSRR